MGDILCEIGGKGVVLWDSGVGGAEEITMTHSKPKFYRPFYFIAISTSIHRYTTCEH